MIEIGEAKAKAEKYLFWVIGQKWNDFNIRVQSQELENIEMLDWPLRFEAYNYLGKKYNYRKKDFALEIRDLWKEWVEINREGNLWKGMVFWPFSAARIIENYVTMFRAKEVFGLGGFDSYFTAAENALDSLYTKQTPRLCWQIVRSSILKSKYAKIYFELAKFDQDIMFFSGNLENRDLEGESPKIQRLIEKAYFLCFGNYIEMSLTKGVISNLIEYQKKNGSFQNSIFETCLLATSIRACNADPSGIVNAKAIEYLFQQQSGDGYWKIELPFASNSIGWKTFSTVLVLRTVDFISRRPVLSVESKNKKQDADLTKKYREQPRLSIPIPSDWGDVSIRFISDIEVEIRVGKIPFGLKNYRTLDFVDKRNDKPDQAWGALKVLATKKGDISFKDGYENKTVERTLKSRVKTIRKRFKAIFGIQTDPFFPYKSEHSYRTKFSISKREEDLI